jgi:hypothetical protein
MIGPDFLGRLATQSLELPFLKELGLQELVPIPTIVIVGMPHAGKASVLERLLGVSIIPKAAVQKSLG